MSNFQFTNKIVTIAGALCALGAVLALTTGNSFGWGFALGAVVMMTVNAYKPSSQPAASKPQQKPANSNNNSNNSNQAADADAEPSDITTLFVGNLAFKANRHELNKLFSEYGLVHSVRLMTDRQTRKPRGFGFVEMASCDTAATIEALNDYEFFGRQLRVNEANERKPRT